MGEIEKVKEKPPPSPEEQTKEPQAPKVSQSAFDKAMEQARLIQQSPTLQSRLADRESSEQRVKETAQKRDSWEESKKDDGETSSKKDKVRHKEKGSETVIRDAVDRSHGQRGSGGGSGGGRGSGGGSGGELARRQDQLMIKRLHEIRGGLSKTGEAGSTFAAKLAQAAREVLSPQQMQRLVNQIVQAIRLGKNELGEAELYLSLHEHIFKGLRLRFTSKRGKASIQIMTATQDVKELFASEAGKIREALEEKGVAVSEIKVS